jgi:predicted nucleic-acid-binding Zn-ribbon protein
MTNQTKCVKCEGEMEKGFMLDRAAGGAALVGEWVEGEPERSIWTGTKISDRAKYKIQSFRCSRCGYLELFANG